MHLVIVAVRNVFRNTRRTLLTVAGISTGVAAIILLGGYYEYNYWGLRESLIRSQYAHIQISRNGFWTMKDQAPFDYQLPDWEAMMTWLDGQTEVETVSPHLSFWGLADVPDGTTALVKIRGVIPERENQLNTFFTRKAGLDLRSADTYAAELGYTLAENLRVKPGTNLFLSTVAADGTHNAMEVTAKSLIGSYSSDFDSRIVRLPLTSAQALANIPGVQELLVLLVDTDQTEAFRKKIVAHMPAMSSDIVLTTWDQRAGYYGQVVQFYGGYFRIILFIVTVVAFFSTLNTMIMAISERTEEIGTLRSFGSTRVRIVLQFLLEGLAIGLIGTIAGIALALAGSGLIDALGGIPMSPPPGLTTQVQVLIMVNLRNVVDAASIGLLVPLTAALLPGLQTARSQIIDQIRRNY